MIQKLKTNEYLKRYDNMTADERQAYEERVGEWLKMWAPILYGKTEGFESRLQNVLQASGGWNDQECHAFEEGARLLSALVSTGETWLPDMLYVKSAKRVVRRITEMLESGVMQQDANGGTRFDVRIQAGAAKEALFTVKTGGAASVSPGAKQTTKTAASFQGGAGDGDLAGGNHKGEAEVRPAPVRPKHIDQYVHLLPQKTQERAAQVKDLLRELDEAREKMQLLMDDKTAKADDREAWAKKATAIDSRVRKIYDELDSEWAKLVKEGRVVVDDLGNARIVESGERRVERLRVGEQSSGMREQNGACTSSAEREQSRPEDRARRRELRKWLVDTRRGNGESREEHVKKWRESFKEFLSFEGDAAFEDEKIKAAAEHYGIDMVSLKDIVTD